MFRPQLRVSFDRHTGGRKVEAGINESVSAETEGEALLIQIRAVTTASALRLLILFASEEKQLKLKQSWTSHVHRG